MLALLAGLVVAATSPTPAPPPIDSLSWLPEDIREVTGAPGAEVPLLKWFRGTFAQYAAAIGAKPPECWVKVTAPVVASYQIWAGLKDETSPVLAQGHIDRSALTACIEKTLRFGRSEPRVVQVGAITQVETDDFGRSYIGWTPSWIIWHPDRARVEELVAATKKRRRSIAPALSAAVSRTDRPASMWFATTKDFSALFLNVPSRSLSGSVDTTTTSDPKVRVIFEYPSADEANRAAAAVTAAAANDTLPPEVRALARDARSIPKDRLLELEFSGKAMFSDGTTAALQAWIAKKKAELPGP